MSRAMVKGDNGKWEDRSVEILHGLVVAHYTKLGFYDHATALKQQVYALGEAGELSVDGVLKNDIEEIKDGIGDVMVCLINWAHLEGVDFMAYYSPTREGKSFLSCSADSLCLHLHYHIAELENEYCLGEVLGILATLGRKYDLTLAECLGHSYDVVFNRKVKPLNGTLVKEADWHKFPELEGVDPL